jgi:cytochrome c peroxidase
MDSLPAGARYQHDTCIRAEGGTAMRRRTWLLAAAVCATVLGGLTVYHAASAQDDISTQKKKPPPTETEIYDPYPPNILPDDLVSEMERVQREIRGIFKEALAEWRALPPPRVLAQEFHGSPLTLQGTGYQAVQILGKLLNYDLNMSVNRDMACASCHMPYAAFSGPMPSVNLTTIAYPGSADFRFGKRTPQRYTYSPRFPVLQYNEVQGLFFGGNFWDARSTGYLLQSADAEQAQHPPVDTQEHGLPDTACIPYRLSQAEYRPLFELIWGRGSLDIKWPQNTEKICSTPGGAAVFDGNPTPISLSPADRTKANRAYDNWGQSISFFESSKNVSAFSSKFDAFLANKYTLTAEEQAGYDLFRGKAGCNTCHLDGRGSTQEGGTDTSAAVNAAVPLFTCFGYSNLGLPLNPRDAFYYQTEEDPFGFTPNPLGFGYRDLGIGTFLRSGFGSAPNPNGEWVPLAPTVDGQVQVMTARNVAMTPPQCPTTEAGQTENGEPVPYFQKAFFHNGYIKSLKQLVHFYNTRDEAEFMEDVTSGHCPEGKTEKVDCWPMPEVPNNIDMTIGKLGLTDEEEDLIVVFLQTLTDGFTTPYPDRDKFTGKCMTGGSAATQGNAFLIPTPELPPCAPEVCGVAPVPKPPIP